MFTFIDLKTELLILKKHDTLNTCCMHYNNNTSNMKQNKQMLHTYISAAASPYKTEFQLMLCCFLAETLIKD